MHPRTEELLRHLDATRVTLYTTVDAVPGSIRETRPAPDRWSVTEVLEHLARVEEQLTRLLTMKLSEARTNGLLEPELETSSVVVTLDRAHVLDRGRRVMTSDRLLPRGEMDSEAARAALDRSRAALRELVTAYDGLSLVAFTFPHPVLGVINGYQWLAFIGMHEVRHANQIREIAESLGVVSFDDEDP
jgi:uncharacterized damage-inducible protein DinB